jgi:hypothetical protein
MADENQAADQGTLFHYTVDGEPQTTAERVLTPHAILVKAGLNPDERYLVLVRGNTQESYQGRPDVEIHMHPHMVFVTIYTGPVTVS